MARHSRSPSSDGTFVASLGALGAIGVAAVLSPLRDTAFGHTNAALVLVLVVSVTASLGGRTAGMSAALTAAMSFNFFLTEPYGSLKIDDTRDLTTFLLLLVVGLVIGGFAQVRSRRLGELRQNALSAHRLERLAALLASEMPHDELCAAVADEIRDELDLVAAIWQPVAVATGLPVMDRAGSVPDTVLRHRPEGFEFPSGGVELPVSYAGARLGAIVLLAKPGHGVATERRHVAVALADLLASALARGSADWGPRNSGTPNSGTSN